MTCVGRVLHIRTFYDLGESGSSKLCLSMIKWEGGHLCDVICEQPLTAKIAVNSASNNRYTGICKKGNRCTMLYTAPV